MAQRIKGEGLLILVTGGAGYIGSQVVRQLQAQGEAVIVMDDLSTGKRDTVEGCEIVEADFADESALRTLFRQHNIKTVVHFAAKIIVSESIEKPLDYYLNNTSKTITLLRFCDHYKVKNFIFSSTAAVYGVPKRNPVEECDACWPISPYGHSKKMAEQVLMDSAKTSSLSYVILRYFNVVGADSSGQFGPTNIQSTLLFRVAAQVAIGQREKLLIFGHDFDTSDGTGVRDYIHVVDIANAHIAALDYLRNQGGSCVMNCGYGRGFSVMEVVRMFEQVTGKSLAYDFVDRRQGDPAALVADSTSLQKAFNWRPRHNDLKKLVEDTWLWEQTLF